MAAVRSGYFGPLPASIWAMLSAVYETSGLATQGDPARSYAVEVALAASMGWITTIDPDAKRYGNRWRITMAGLTALSNKDLYAYEP